MGILFSIPEAGVLTRTSMTDNMGVMSMGPLTNYSPIFISTLLVYSYCQTVRMRTDATML